MTNWRHRMVFYCLLLLAPTRSLGDSFGASLRCGSYTCAGNRTDQPCGCDEVCGTYGDCCPDYRGRVRSFDSDITSSIECLNTYYAGQYLLVGKCPAEYRDPWIREMCQTKWPGMLKEYMIPVRSLKSQFSYKNTFCALCNGQTIHDSLQFWSYEYACKNGTLKNLTAEQLVPQVLQGRCHIRFTESTRRWCKSNAIGCVRSLDVMDDAQRAAAKMCYSYVDYVRASGGQLYRNAYCFQCSGVSSELRCNHKIDIPNTALSRLMKYSSGKQGFSHGDIEKEVTCNSKSIYYKMSCKNLMCPTGYVADDNKRCVFEESLYFGICGRPGDPKKIFGEISYFDLFKKRGTCNREDISRQFLIRKGRDGRAVIERSLRLLRDDYMKIIFVSKVPTSDIFSHFSRNCKYFKYSGNFKEVHEQTLAFFKRSVNITKPPWYINITSARREHNSTTYDVQAQICHMNPTCRFMSLIPRDTIPTLTTHALTYRKPSLLGVCADRVKDHETAERSRRNRGLMMFLERSAYSCATEQASFTVFIIGTVLACATILENANN